MSTSQTQTIPREKFLIMATNLLHRTLLDVPRTRAKNVFKEMGKGQVFHLTTVEMEDKSTVRFDVTLDHSEFRGKINFSAFRSSLALLVGNLVQSLEDNRDITVFSAENDSNVMIFGVTAVTREGENINVMVLGADASDGQPSILLRLMYLDHSQFADEVQQAQGRPRSEQSA